ncbi:MAG: cell division protein CrgA [Actinomycetia bacterium]|nr:cell division protein CrgA [Actinomycetes bacterium]
MTPKGTRPDRPSASTRYTPPDSDAANGPSPAWVPILMFALLGIGVLIIIVNYLDVLPGGSDNWWLIGGLGLVLGGIITATQYR